VLLLVLAVAMGMFAIGQGASWDRSQRDQADFSVGADIRVTGMTTPPFGQAGIFTHVPGITAAAPAARSQLLLTEQRHATALVIDTRTAASAMRFRGDLTGGRSVADVLAPLRNGEQNTGAKAAPDGFAVPGTTATVAFTATLRATAANGGALPPPQTPDVADHLTATLVDALGVYYDFSLGDLPPDGAPHVLTLDLASAAGSAGGAPAGPLRLVRIDTVFTVPGQPERRLLTLTDARITGTGGAVQPLGRAAGQPWSSNVDYDDPTLSDLPSNVRPGALDPHTDGPALYSLSYTTGKIAYAADSYQQAPTVTVHTRAARPDPPTLTAVATDSYLRAVGAKVGSSIQIQLGGVDTTVRIAGSVRAVPGTIDPDTAVPDTSDTPDSAQGGASADDGRDKDAGALLLDLRAVNRLLESQDAPPMQPTEWWVATQPGSSARVAAALRARNDVDTLLVRDERAAELRADPLGAGPQSALPAAVIAAAVLAAVGFAVSSAGAIRERNAEFAVLRALGAPRRKLARMIAAEQGLLVLISLAVGVALGALLTRLVTPLIVLTAQAAQPVPTLLVRLPAGPLVQLLAVVLAAPLLVVLATAIRRGDPASALRRQGED
jgi:hypothetical protein